MSVATTVLLLLLEHLNNFSGKKKRNLNFRNLLYSEHHCFPYMKIVLSNPKLHQKARFLQKTLHFHSSAIRTAQLTSQAPANAVCQNTVEAQI